MLTCFLFFLKNQIFQTLLDLSPICVGSFTSLYRVPLFELAISQRSVESNIKGIKADISKADSLSGQPVLTPGWPIMKAWSGSLGLEVTLDAPLVSAPHIEVV